MKYLIFIPARSGSKTVKYKNIKKIKKKPLIFYTLKTAKEIKKKIQSNIFVSTDSDKILKICKRFVKLSNYLRPKKLSGDNSNIIDAIFHCIKNQTKLKKKYEAIILLQPTSPVRDSTEIIKAIKYFENHNLKSMMSVCNVREHPNEIIKIKRNLKWKYIFKKKRFYYQKQQFEKNYYFIDGNFYISTIDFLIKHKSFVSSNETVPFISKKTWPIDIDYLDDFKVAESFIK